MKKLTIIQGVTGLFLLGLLAALPSCKDKCDTEAMSFKTDMLPILKDNGCTASSCHGAGSSNGDLTIYAGLKFVADENRILGALRQEAGFSAMPKGGSKMDDCDIDKIAAWIEQGKKDN